MADDIMYLADEGSPTLKITVAEYSLTPRYYEYTGEAFYPLLVLTYNEETLQLGVDYSLEYKDNVEPGNARIIVTGMGRFYGTRNIPFTIGCIPLLNRARIEWLEEDDTCIYTGAAYEPDFIVWDGDTLLEENVDYTKRYSGNIDAGTASVGISGKGYYQGDLTDYFIILPRDINETDFSMDDKEYIFTGEAIVPEYKIYYNGILLEENRDFKTEIENNTNVGIATITFTGMNDIYGQGNFCDSFSVDFEIKQKEITAPEVTTNVMETPVYTGEPLIPRIDVKCNNIPLVEGIDYTIGSIEGYNNTDAGQGYLLITGINNFFEQKIIPFDIARKDLSDTDVKIEYEDGIEYTGLEIIPEVKITYGNNVLEIPKDYSYTVSNNVNVTEMALITITATLNGNYTGSIKKYFTIIAATGAIFELQLEAEEFEYTGSAITPEIKVYHDGIEYTSYDITFNNNTNVVKDNDEVIAAAELKVTIKGNYSGNITKKFKILPTSIDNCNISVANKEYNFINGPITPELIIKLNNNTISLDQYKITEYLNNIYVTEEAIIRYSFISDNFIEKNEIREFAFKIVPTTITSCNITLTPSNFVYDGEEKCPVPSLTLNNEKIEDVNYTFNYGNNINAGNGRITLFGSTNLIGSRTVAFTINPAVLTVNNCAMRAEEYEPGCELYNLATLKVYYIKENGEEMLLTDLQDYYSSQYSENNLNLEVVQTTVTITAVEGGNFIGEVETIFDTATLTAGDMSDILQQIEKKPGYTYIQYSEAMEGMFKISSQGKSAIDELNTQLYNHGYANESATINTIPIYYLKPNTIIYIRDEETKVNGEYVISKINIPLGGNGTMSITATKAMKRIY